METQSPVPRRVRVTRASGLWLVPSSIVLGVSLLGAHAAAIASGPGTDEPPVAPLGEIDWSPGTSDLTERVRLDPLVAARLLALAPGESVRLAGWPVAPALRQDVLLRRFDVYAPGARILAMTPSGPVELPRSRLVFFSGTAAGGEARVLVGADPRSGRLFAHFTGAAGTFRLKDAVEGGEDYLLARAAVKGLDRFRCSVDQADPSRRALAAPVVPPGTRSALALLAVQGLRTATVAVDTDNQLLLRKFADDTSEATDWIASLFASMTVFFERDLEVRLLQGTTILRPSAQPDPYSDPDLPWATTAELDEFSAHWEANNAGVSRTVATLLSGRQDVDWTGTGVGWQGVLCDTHDGYTVNLVRRLNDEYDVSWNSMLIGHELGHNFGSPHTHCYSPPVDTCYTGEGGCWSGAETCPTPQTLNGVPNVLGTLMSYCNLLWPDCDTHLVFHPRTRSEYVEAEVQSAVGSCMTADPPGPSLFHPVTPCRLVDTRNPNGPLGGPGIAAGAVRSFAMAGVCGIPADARALSLNVTVTGATAAGTLGVFPGVGAPPVTDTVAFSTGKTRATSTIVGLTGGTLSAKNRQTSGSLQLVIDVNGYFR